MVVTSATSEYANMTSVLQKCCIKRRFSFDSTL